MKGKNEFRLDRTKFSCGTVEEADDHVCEWENKSYSERMQAAFYLINKIYGTTNLTKLDRTVFSMRKQEEYPEF